MTSLTSNPMDEMDEEYQEASVGHKRSYSNPGADQTRPGSLNFTSGSISNPKKEDTNKRNFGFIK